MEKTTQHEQKYYIYYVTYDDGPTGIPEKSEGFCGPYTKEKANSELESMEEERWISGAPVYPVCYVVTEDEKLKKEQTAKQNFTNTSYFNDCNVNGEPAVNESNRYNTAEDFYDAYTKNIDEYIENGEFIKNVEEVEELDEVMQANMLPLDFKFLFAALTSKTLTKECKADLLKGSRPNILETLNSLAKTILTLQVTDNGFTYAEERKQG